ncbi:MAG TPA: ABC transporter ATP-binding protein [Chloroflexia bacterium]|nr:ABC transporter ATP-binding protein [Chloroflexia bacterium]
MVLEVHAQPDIHPRTAPPDAVADPVAPPTPAARPPRRLAIQTVNVSRVYKLRGEKTPKGTPPRTLTALGGVTLEVAEGELFGLLGPNGAGKTTLIKILTTLLTPSSGTCRVDGLDVVRDADEVRRRINMVSGGETSGFGILTVRENLWMFSQFYGIPSRAAYARIDELLKVVELDDKAHARINSLSTGQRQRMNFCRGFVTDPKILFLDEPTLGLDVNAARIVRDFTRDWMRRHPDRTVLLTTHYMAEADELCDRLAIIDHGAVLACDTPANLKRLVQKQPIFAIQVAGLGPRSLAVLGQAPGVVRVTGDGDAGTGIYTLQFILESEAAIGAVVTALTSQQGQIMSLQKHEPTLEDVFVKLVGRSLSTSEA